MRIAVSARLLIKDKLEGMGVFAFESLRRMAAAHPEHEFIYIFDRAFDPAFLTSPNIKGIRVGFPARHPILWYIWLRWSLPAAIKRINPDLFFSPDGFIPFKNTVPVLNVIHDLNFEYFPEWIPKPAGNFYRRHFPSFAENSNRLLTVSDYSKSSMIEKYGIAANKLEVVHNAGLDDYQPLAEKDKTSIRKKWTDGAPYFLYVGSLNPRKNISGLLQAFDLFKSEKYRPLKLLLAGSAWNIPGKEQLTALLTHRSDILFTGHLKHSDLKDVLGAAQALTYVPFFEGFGIPIIEAMQSGVPVITSDCTSIPEVAGGAALLTNPHDIRNISAAMHLLADDEQLRADLIRKGLLNAKRFSWDKTSASIWKNILILAEKKT